MTDRDEPRTPPSWWRVEDRRAARDAEREIRREGRAADRAARRATRHGVATHEPVTPDGIADAALRVIDTQGLDGLTVRTLAQELGIGTMTLYWYVRNKDEVLDLVADRLLAQVEAPSEKEDWRDATRLVATSVRAAFLGHPQAVPIIVGRGSFGPNALRLIESGIGVFRSAGFSDAGAADAYATMSNFVTGFCTAETATSGLSPVDREARSNAIRNYIALLSPDRYPNLVAGAPRLFGGEADERFAFGITCVLAGLERMLESDRGRRA